MALIISFIVTFGVAYFIYKRYKPQVILTIGGFVLMYTAVLIGYGTILEPKASTGTFLLDTFEFLSQTLSSRAASLGLNIMCVGAFAKYMDSIGASRALVRLTIRPLVKLKSPYVVLALSWIMGMCIGLCINSASGLAMLLMVTVYPILIGLGVSRLAAAAAVASTLCFDWSPSDVGTILSAETAGLNPVIYWTDYQVPIVLVSFVVVGTLFYFSQKFMDRRDGHIVTPVAVGLEQGEADTPPLFYALLPIIPLVLILVFSPLWITWIKVNIINAMFIGFAISFICETLHKRDLKEVCAGVQNFFDGMGMQMANVVTLIVAGQIFAQGLMSMGVIDILIKSSQNAGFSPMMMMLVMVAIIAASSIVMGSGNASFFAFAALTPAVASASGIAPVLLLLPMHFAASIARVCSPIAAVIVISAGMADVSPFDLVKRTAIPMAGAMLVNVAMTFFYYCR